jgi:predicted phage terminase large subunit-like protein
VDPLFVQKHREIRPQPGPQTEFLGTTANIAIYGGAAGSGKTYSLLMEPIRHYRIRSFAAVIFRKTLADVKKAGSLWDTSHEVYSSYGKPKVGTLSWSLKPGGKIVFAYLERFQDTVNWMGSQIPLLMFDELTHFDKDTFFYMLSRNRSVIGIRPYVRCTTNPDANSWVAEFLSWWIDQETGFPIPERAGKLRYFVRQGDDLIWANTAERLVDVFGPASMPKSVTFIPAKVTDNRVLMTRDPGYMANLLALSYVERMRLLEGNWKIKPSAGLYFRREWVTVVETIPEGTRFVRGYDLAATEKTASNDPDFTCSTKIGRTPEGRFIVVHHSRAQESPSKVERKLLTTATADGREVRIHIPQDPGSAGKTQVEHLAQLLAGFDVRFAPASGDKIVRFGPFSAQAEAGNVAVLRASWNDVWFTQLENFPEGKHDDDADSTSEAFNGLTGGLMKSGHAIYELERERAQQREREKKFAVSQAQEFA